MAENILSSLLAKPSFVVLNKTTTITMLSDLKVSRVSIKFHSEPQRHLMESGNTEIDTRIIKPTRLIADVFCPDVDTFKQVNEVLSDVNSLFQITTRGLIIDNLMVDSDAIKQSGEMTSATPVRMSFKQILMEGSSPIIFANQSDSSLLDKGTALLDKVENGVSDLVDKASGLVDKASDAISKAVG